MRVLALVLLAIASAARAYEVPAFVKVQVCTPFNVIIGASSYPNHYNVTVEGDSSVASAVSAKVANGVLYLESDGDFSTQNPVKVTVRLPPSKLQTVKVSSAAGIVVVVDKGFAVTNLTAEVLGAADLVFYSLTANTVQLINSGTGNIIFNGPATAATVHNAGTGTVYVANVSEAVAVSASGTSSVLVNSPNNLLKITGEASGISTIKYNQGVCSATATDLGNACLRAGFESPKVQTLWSCGLALSGTFTCRTGASVSASTTGGGNSGSSYTSTSGSGGSAFASSSSSVGSSSSGFSSSTISSDGSGTISTNSIPSATSAGSNTLTTNTGKLSSLKCSASVNTLKMKL